MLDEIAIASIHIGERHRTDLGDIHALAESIAGIGLLHPIVITKDHRLIVGRRRLAAYVHLGRETIPAQVIDLANPLLAERDENAQRKDFTPSEKVAIAEAIEAQEAQQAKQRQQDHGKTAPGRKKNTSENFTQVFEQPPRARDVAAAAVGWSGPTYARAKAVVEAARDDPDLHELVEQMDRTGNVSRAYRQLPSYAREVAASEPDKPTRHLSYNAMIQRLDHWLGDTLTDSTPFYTDEQRQHIQNVLTFYATVLADRKDMIHDDVA